MRYAKYLLLLYPLACVALFLWYIHWKKGTNYGVDFYDNIYLLGFFAAIAAYQLERRGQSFFMAALVVNVVVAIFFIAADRFNIMLDYEKWIGRGMPGPFEKSLMRKVETDPELDKLDDELSSLRREVLERELNQEEYDLKAASIRERCDNLKNKKAGH